MLTHHVFLMAAGSGGGPSTGGLVTWIQQNIISVILIILAVIAFALSRKGEHSSIMRMLPGVGVGIVLVGLAAAGSAGVIHLGQWFDGLVGIT